MAESRIRASSHHFCYNRKGSKRGKPPREQSDKELDASAAAGTCRYRKIHLFDVDIPGGPRLQESRLTAPGSEVRPHPSASHVLLIASK